MKSSIARSSTVACGLLLLAACSGPITHTGTPQARDGIVAEDVGAAPALPPPPPAPVVEAARSVTVTGARASQPSAIGRYKAASSPLAYAVPPPQLRILIPAPPGADRFPDKEANQSTLVAEQPVSTFSVDVDTASYAFVRRMLTAGQVPRPDAVRVEEMVNYFPYHYAAPRSRDVPFAVATEVMPSPWKAGNQLVHIAVRGYDIQAAARPRANVVLLVDISGSMMGPDRLPLLQQGFRLFAQQLRDDDRVAIVTYANGTHVALAPTEGRDKDRIIDAIDALRASGGTAGGDGLQRAYAMAERHFDPKAVNRVILATDGDFNIGITDPKQLEKFVADKRKTGVYLSIFGVGMGNLNDALIQRLAQSGNGNAAYIDSLLEARKALADELGSTMFPIASDVKVQVEFNPDQVAAYRLIGYETRMLQRQDFKDDKVDAGDMGAGHTVTAIYEITPAGAASELVDPLRYGQPKKDAKRAAGKDKGELCFVKLRYKLPSAATSRLVEHPVPAASSRESFEAAPDDQRFAVAVAAFGQRLRGERQLADTSYASIAELANAARGPDPEGYRAEFVKLVRMAESLDKAGPARQAGQP